jgi:hypothetical protein
MQLPEEAVEFVHGGPKGFHLSPEGELLVVGGEWEGHPHIEPLFVDFDLLFEEFGFFTVKGDIEVAEDLGEEPGVEGLGLELLHGAVGVEDEEVGGYWFELKVVSGLRELRIGYILPVRQIC